MGIRRIQDDIEEIIITEEQIAKKVNELAQEILKDYEDKDEDVLMVGILKGSNVFMSDLIRKIQLPLMIDFMVVSSYGNSTETSGVVRILKDLEYDIKDKNVVIIEDIIDTGLTLSYLKENLIRREPKTLKICTLLDKPSRRKIDIKVDYKGFEIPDQFIVGYGIDFAEKYRNLPYVGVLKREMYNII